jgi:hypothetical protein
MSGRITACENKLEEHDNILADILSRLTHAGIWTKIIWKDITSE